MKLNYLVEKVLTTAIFFFLICCHLLLQNVLVTVLFFFSFFFVFTGALLSPLPLRLIYLFLVWLLLSYFYYNLIFYVLLSYTSHLTLTCITLPSTQLSSRTPARYLLYYNFLFCSCMLRVHIPAIFYCFLDSTYHTQLPSHLHLYTTVHT